MKDIAAYAESLVGKSRYDLNLRESTEWCAEAASFILEHTVDPDKEFHTISCNDMIFRMSRSDKFYEPEDEPRRSDYLFFDHDRDKDPLKDSKPLDHVAVITNFDGEYIEYVDGNGDSSGIVKKRRRHISTFNFECKYPDYYMRYCGDQKQEAEPPEQSSDEGGTEWLRTLKCGDKGHDVQQMQSLLIADGYSCGSAMMDGDFGPATEKAIINFQTDHKIECTGICDRKTWKELLRR